MNKIILSIGLASTLIVSSVNANTSINTGTSTTSNTRASTTGVNNEAGTDVLTPTTPNPAAPTTPTVPHDHLNNGAEQEGINPNVDVTTPKASGTSETDVNLP